MFQGMMASSRVGALLFTAPLPAAMRISFRYTAGLDLYYVDDQSPRVLHKSWRNMIPAPTRPPCYSDAAGDPDDDPDYADVIPPPCYDGLEARFVLVVEQASEEAKIPSVGGKLKRRRQSVVARLDDSKPARRLPMSGYIMFSQQLPRQNYTRATEFYKDSGRRWQALSESDRQRWKEFAERQRVVENV